MMSTTMAARIHGEPPFAYADLRRWPEDERWELIDGQAFAMASPSWQHQRVSMRLGSLLDAHFVARGCLVFAAPRVPPSPDS
jgi:Uma2 family endonuclease